MPCWRRRKPPEPDEPAAPPDRGGGEPGGPLPEFRYFPDPVGAGLEDEKPRPDPERFEAFFDALDPSGSPTAYLFRCLHCGTHLGYSDTD